ncbi:MAG: tRNA glutamyl-Q(34) synthetase GluQRS [Saccharospirillum sp.]
MQTGFHELMVPPYRGRFAPTPSGELHLGSLLAAVISYLEARRNQGQWLVRMEDLDPPREQRGAADAILRCLEAHGLYWDESVLYQSRRYPAYEAALEQLHEQGVLFWCQCSRKQLRGHRVYPGTCRAFHQPRPDSAIRLRITDYHDGFIDGFQGEQSACPAGDFGDVVLRRRDGFYAYQLAVVVDDHEQGITDVVRGIDLLHASYWQQALYRQLGQSPPRWLHFPVLVGGDGEKLSKQHRAAAIALTPPQENLMHVFSLLQLTVEAASPEQMLAQALAQWHPERLRNRQTLPMTLAKTPGPV